MKIKSYIPFSDTVDASQRRSPFEHDRGRRADERHKSRLASRETDDGLSGRFSRAGKNLSFDLAEHTGIEPDSAAKLRILHLRGPRGSTRRNLLCVHV